MIKEQKNVVGLKPVIKAKDMDEEMFKGIEKWARETYENTKEKLRDEMDIANFLKDKLEDKYKDKDLCWHVIVGRHFGGYVTYQEKMYTYFYIGQFGYLIFATVKFFIYLA